MGMVGMPGNSMALNKMEMGMGGYLFLLTKVFFVIPWVYGWIGAPRNVSSNLQRKGHELVHKRPKT